MYSRYLKTEYGIEVLEDNRKAFEQSLKVGEEFINDHIKGDKLRTYLQVKYLFGGVYKTFAKESFNNDPSKAHKELAEMFLVQTSEIDDDDIQEKIKIYSKFRKDKPVIKEEKTFRYRGKEFKVVRKLTWVQSVGSLTRKKLITYIDKIVLEASKVGITILSSDEYKKLNV